MFLSKKSCSKEWQDWFSSQTFVVQVASQSCSWRAPVASTGSASEVHHNTYSNERAERASRSPHIGLPELSTNRTSYGTKHRGSLEPHQWSSSCDLGAHMSVEGPPKTNQQATQSPWIPSGVSRARGDVNWLAYLSICLYIRLTPHSYARLDQTRLVYTI